MSRPQNGHVTAPESPASARTDTRASEVALGRQIGAELTGKCKECRGPVWLVGDAWIHDGLGYWVHLVLTMKARGA